MSYAPLLRKPGHTTPKTVRGSSNASGSTSCNDRPYVGCSGGKFCDQSPNPAAKRVLDMRWRAMEMTRSVMNVLDATIADHQAPGVPSVASISTANISQRFFGYGGTPWLKELREHFLAIHQKLGDAHLSIEGYPEAFPIKIGCGGFDNPEDCSGFNAAASKSDGQIMMCEALAAGSDIDDSALVLLHEAFHLTDYAQPGDIYTNIRAFEYATSLPDATDQAGGMTRGNADSHEEFARATVVDHQPTSKNITRDKPGPRDTYSDIASDVQAMFRGAFAVSEAHAIRAALATGGAKSNLGFPGNQTWGDISRREAMEVLSRSMALESYGSALGTPQSPSSSIPGGAKRQIAAFDERLREHFLTTLRQPSTIGENAVDGAPPITNPQPGMFWINPRALPGLAPQERVEAIVQAIAIRGGKAEDSVLQDFIVRHAEAELSWRTEGFLQAEVAQGILDLPE